jgi:anti-sigma factor RsiW
MENEKVMDLIQRDLDGDCTPAEKAELEAHLAANPEDAKLLEHFRILSENLSQLPKVTLSFKLSICFYLFWMRKRKTEK